MEEKLQSKLNQYALTIRKYNLGDKNYFFSSLHKLNKNKLSRAWTFAQKKIQNREIIKNASHITIEDSKYATFITSIFDNSTNELYKKLNSKFDVKELKLSDENVERRVRNILALRYLQNLSTEIQELQNNEADSFKSKALRFAKKIKYGLIAVGIVGVFSAPRIIDGLSPAENILNDYLHENYEEIKTSKINVDVLSNYLHEDSRYKFNGAICNDGWTSHSQGRGTCSHHKGVDYYFYKGNHSKNIQQCRSEAKNIIAELKTKALKRSWLD